MTDFVFPRNDVLNRVAQDKIPSLVANRTIFSILPMRNIEASLLRWIQKDNYRGLMALRGLNGPPTAVQQIADNEYQAEPGYYGEMKTVNEREMTTRRNAADRTGGKVDVADLVAECQDHLLQRRLDRIEQIGWALVAAGTFSITGPNGIVHSDTFSIKTYNGSTWATRNTATPIADLQAAQLLGRGTSNRFDQSSVAYMNLVTMNDFLGNTNATDLGGKLTVGGGTLNDLSAMNSILTGLGLPRMAVMDDGYINDSGTFVPFLANGQVVIIGSRPGNVPIGYFAFTLNANNPGASPGPYMLVVDKTGLTVPPSIEVHDGFNGGPILEYPGGIVSLDAS